MKTPPMHGGPVPWPEVDFPPAGDGLFADHAVDHGGLGAGHP